VIPGSIRDTAKAAPVVVSGTPPPKIQVQVLVREVSVQILTTVVEIPTTQVKNVLQLKVIVVQVMKILVVVRVVSVLVVNTVKSQTTLVLTYQSVK